MYEEATTGSTSNYKWYTMTGFPTDIVNDWDHVWVRFWASSATSMTAYVRYEGAVVGEVYHLGTKHRKGWNTAPSGGPWTESILDGIELGYLASEDPGSGILQVYYTGSAAPTPSPTPTPTP